jgi:3-hydroxyisobutyrate dehydrogenase
MKLQSIGWIGLGTMGNPMANSLIKNGYQLTVFNRDSEKAKAFEKLGAAIANSPSDLIAAVDIVIVMVTDDKAIKDIFEGDNGLLKSDAFGKTIINMSTVSPEISQHMNKSCTELGHRYMDAPVSGSVKQANEATLIIIAVQKSVCLKALNLFWKLLEN